MLEQLGIQGQEGNDDDVQKQREKTA